MEIFLVIVKNNSNLAAGIRYNQTVLEKQVLIAITAHLITVELGTDVSIASGRPNPTKYGQWLSM